MESGKYHAITAPIKEGQGETLVTAGIVEGAEADQADVLHGRGNNTSQAIALLLDLTDGARRGAHDGEVLGQLKRSIAVREIGEYAVDAALRAS